MYGALDAKKYAKLQCSAGKATQFELGKTLFTLFTCTSAAIFTMQIVAMLCYLFPPSAFGVQ